MRSTRFLHLASILGRRLPRGRRSSPPTSASVPDAGARPPGPGEPDAAGRSGLCTSPDGIRRRGELAAGCREPRLPAERRTTVERGGCRLVESTWRGSLIARIRRSISGILHAIRAATSAAHALGSPLRGRRSFTIAIARPTDVSPALSGTFVDRDSRARFAGWPTSFGPDLVSTALHRGRGVWRGSSMIDNFSLSRDETLAHVEVMAKAMLATEPEMRREILVDPRRAGAASIAGRRSTQGRRRHRQATGRLCEGARTQGAGDRAPPLLAWHTVLGTGQHKAP